MPEGRYVGARIGLGDVITMGMGVELECRVAALEEILPLREAVIIAGTGRPAEFPGDRDAATVHFGAFLDGANVCCGTFMLNEWFGEPAYQLRGMATRPDLRGRGAGAAMLVAAERHIAAHTPVRQLWCSARIGAVAFYQKCGWSVVSEVYEVPNVGPHRKMCKRIA
ncbi:MAG: GNAT family N-acetyltransferase [Candidatus Hydrogenedentes bacterium]|nr:GNAT family N-acetyltransferase [Candidatus Hydrogenedentota bacterium]